MIDNCGNIYVMTFSKLLKLTDLPITKRESITIVAFTVYMENSLWFEILLWSNWPKWNLHRWEFHFAWTHVNADNEVALHRSEIAPRGKSQTGLSSLRVSCKRALTYARNMTCLQGIIITSIHKNSSSHRL